jgi:serine/threonine protein kinase
MDRPTSPMTAERWMQLKKILEAVQSKPAAEQAEMICALAQGDEELELAVRNLLSADERAGAFLQTPVAELHSPLLAPGARLGPYQILGLLGEGGMGEVYRARDLRVKREVAIKVLPRSYCSDPERLQRFQREAEAIAALNHPNILSLYHVGEQVGAPYLVTELLQGETLREKLRSGGFAPMKALACAVQIAHELAAAHEKGMGFGYATMFSILPRRSA